MRVQKEKEIAENKMTNLWFDNGELSEFGKICNEAKIAANETRKVHELPHGFTIEQNKYLNDYWSLLCRGNFVFQGSEDECFISFGSHLAGVGK